MSVLLTLLPLLQTDAVTAAPAAARTGDPTTWILLAAGMLLVIYVVFRPMMRRKRDPLDDAHRPFRLSPAQQRDVEQQMSNLLVELSDMARQITSQIDTRAQKLELLIRQADERLEAMRHLEGLTQQPHGGEPVGLTDDDATGAGDGTSAPDGGGAAAGGAGLRNFEFVNPRHNEVYALSDDGLSARQIAERLGKPNGEIELILALRPRRA